MSRTASTIGDYEDPGGRSHGRTITPMHIEPNGSVPKGRTPNYSQNARVRYMLTITTVISVVVLIYMFYKNIAWFVMVGILLMANFGILTFYLRFIPVVKQSQSNLLRHYKPRIIAQLALNVVSITLLAVAMGIQLFASKDRYTVTTLPSILVSVAIAGLILQGLALVKHRLKPRRAIL